MRRIYLITVCLWIAAMPSIVFAHGTDYRLVDNDAVVVAEFFYSDQTPMQYAEVLVFSPGNDKVEYQNGRTDQNGRFAFLAETGGEWRVKVNDGMGHAVQAAVTIEPDIAKADVSDDLPNGRLNPGTKKRNPLLGESPTGVKLVFGLSILLNIFLVMHVLKRRRNGGQK